MPTDPAINILAAICVRLETLVEELKERVDMLAEQGLDKFANDVNIQATTVDYIAKIIRNSFIATGRRIDNANQVEEG